MTSAPPRPPTILVVSAYDLADLVLDAAHELEGRASVRVLRGHFEGAVEGVRRLSAAGRCDIVLSAGANADFLRQHVSVPVVSVRVGGFDVMAALSAASVGAERTALLLFQAIPEEVRRFLRDFRIPVELRSYDSEEDARRIVEELARSGLKTLVGPGVAVRRAREHGLRGVFLYSRASVIAAMDEALGLVQARQAERAERQRLASVLHHLDDGVVAVGPHGEVMAANPAADRLTGVALGAAVGLPLQQALPELETDAALSNDDIHGPRVRFVGGRRLMVRSARLLDAGQPMGAVFTLSQPSDVEQAFRRLRAHEKARSPAVRYTLDHVVQASARMQQVVRRCRTLAEHSEAPVLLTGPTGVGKELLAQGIHSAGKRRGKRFMAVNCGALTPSLLESELFGYDAGAFTGARREGRPGLFEVADGGTVFLDEIGELPLELQTRLLRVLQEKEVVRVGSHEPLAVDVRVVSATHRDLLAMVRATEFRADLYYRLGVVAVQVPPLAERSEDLDLLAGQMVEAALRDVGLQAFLPRVLQLLPQVLRTHAWPGNARELQNFAHRVAVCALESGSVPTRPELLGLIDAWPAEVDPDDLSSRRRHDDVAHIRRVLKECHGSQEAAAARLGISRTTLWRRLKNQGPDVPAG
jgi:propionate catabolism operon transcriptional regulator